MATQTTTTSADAFYKQLGRMYGIYTGGFVAFIVLLAILEQIGVPNKILGYFFVFFTLAVYAIIGVATRTAQISEYYVAGRRVPAFYNGMATGADWMSAASFVGMAGSLFLLGYDGLAWVLGWTGGFVLVSILVGPYLRKFGAYTVPDFLSFRYGGHFARFQGGSADELRAWLCRLLVNNAANFARGFRETDKRQVGREVGLPGDAPSDMRGGGLPASTHELKCLHDELDLTNSAGSQLDVARVVLAAALLADLAMNVA